MKAQSYCMVAILVSSVAVIQTKSWLMMWIVMEINMVMMALQLMEESKKESLILFMIFQSLPGLCMMTYIACSQATLEKTMSGVAVVLLIMAMLCKMGMFPFHNWMMFLSKSMSWTNNTIMMTVQKMIPMAIIVKISMKTMTMLMGVASLMVMSTYIMMMGWVKPFLMASSLMHLTWMIMAMLQSKMAPLAYLGVYSTILWTIVFSMKKKEKKMMTDQVGKTSPYVINMLSLSGIPPTTGFVMKALIVMAMTMSMTSNTMMMMMLTAAAMSFYAYTQLLYKNLYNISSNQKKNEKSKDNRMKSMTTLNTVGGATMYSI